MAKNGVEANGFRVLLDSKCHQGAQHLGTNWPGTCPLCGHKGESPWKGKRLAGLQSALESNGYAFEVSDITESNLSTVSILVVAGRGDPQGRRALWVIWAGAVSLCLR